MTTHQIRLVFDASDLADYCLTDVATIYLWTKKGEIEAFRTPGGRLRFTRGAVLDFLRRHGFPVAPEVARGRSCVVIVDGNAARLVRSRDMLTPMFDVVTNDDAYDGLLSIGRNKPDAVVLGAQPGPFDVIRCIARIRAHDRLRHVRVVVLSDSDAEDERKALLEAGAAAFVATSQFDGLYRTVRQVLGR